LALSTSSPFFLGRLTGLKSYRLSIFDNLPRTGLPPSFASHAHYQRTVDTLIRTGIIEDATKIWWDLRPSARFPTLEMRICDIPTRLEDSMTIAALFLTTTRMLYRMRRENLQWRQYDRFLINENRWRAQRYGMSEGLIDFGRGALVPYPQLLEELLALVRSDAEALGCLAEVEAARSIVARGTSADRQEALYHARLAEGADQAEALKAVVAAIAEETVGEANSE
jgi:glutamate---cysteine ligase / carboxylate-amine ligase